MKTQAIVQTMTETLMNAPEHPRIGNYSRADFVVGFAICGVDDLDVPKSLEQICHLVSQDSTNEMDRQRTLEAIGNLMELGMIVQKQDGFIRAPHVVARQIRSGIGETYALVEMCKNGQYTYMLPTEHQSKEWFDIVQEVLDLECEVRMAHGTTFAASPFTRVTYRNTRPRATGERNE